VCKTWIAAELLSIACLSGKASRRLLGDRLCRSYP
jgi:hypothetical protein